MELIGATPGPIEACFVSIDMNANFTRTSQTYAFDIGIGAAGSEQPIFTNFLSAEDTNIDIMTPWMYGPLACSIPSGVRVAARVMASGTGTTGYAIAMWGVGP